MEDWLRKILEGLEETRKRHRKVGGWGRRSRHIGEAYEDVWSYKNKIKKPSVSWLHLSTATRGVQEDC